MEIKELQYWDNTKSKIRVFKAENASTTFIILPAMGTKARYYETFAARLNQEDYHVVIADWRGHGDFETKASRKNNFGYKELLQDIDALVNQIDEWLPNTQKMFIGHSLGGQLGSLYAARFPDKVEALVLIASCSVYYKGWDGFEATKIYIVVTLLPLIARLVGYFPGKQVGFAGREARQVMKDWAYNGISGIYSPKNDDFDYEKALARLSKDVLAISIDPDNMAPKKAVENLYHKYGDQEKVQHLHVGFKETNIEEINHFTWAKYPDYFVNAIKAWVQSQA